MSWDGYLDNLIGQTKDGTGTTHCDKACIFALDGGAMWTTAAHHSALQITPQEAATIANAMKRHDFQTFQTSGIRVENTKYQYLREQEGKTCYGKCKGKGSITVGTSRKAIVLAHCPESGQQGNLNKGVQVITDYLESMNM